MYPEPITAAHLTAIAALCCACLLWLQGPATPTIRWGMISALLAGAAPVAATGLRPMDMLLASTSAATLSSAALATLTFAVMRLSFRATPSSWWYHLMCFVPVAVCWLLGMWLFADSGALLHDAFALVWGIQSAALWVTLLKIPPVQRTGNRGLVLGMAIEVVACAVVLAISAAWPSAVLASSADRLLAWLGSSVAFAAIWIRAVGLLMLVQGQASAHAHRQALTDALTQLPNRAALIPKLEHSIDWAASQAHSLAIMVMDIDHFKSVNDSHGHLVGDLVIQRIAMTLKQQCRPQDFAARYGGEEFVLVLPSTSAREAFAQAERLCEAVRRHPMQLPNGNTLHITISIGVYACTPNPGSAWQRMVAAADEAMYMAKRNGRDRVALSAPVQAVTSSPIEMA